MKLSYFQKLSLCLFPLLLPLSMPVKATDVTAGTVIVDKAENIKGITKLGVPQYNISFAIEDGQMVVAETKKKGFFGAKATASAYARIVGLQPQTMQKIVDEAYADFISQLTIAGFDVDADAYAKIKDSQHITLHTGPAENKSYYRAFNNKLNDITVAPTGMNVLKSHGNGLGVIADEIGLPFLNVEYLLHFGYIDTETQTTEATLISGSTAEARVTIGQGLQVYWHSGMVVVNGLENAFNKPNAKVMVEKNFYSTAPFGHTTEDEASGGKDGLLGAFTAGFIGGERYVINVVEDEYVSTSLAILKQVNAALVTELAKHR